MKRLRSAFFILLTTVCLDASSIDKSIFINEKKENAVKIKSDFLNKNSKNYSIALSSMKFDEKKLSTLFKSKISENILAHKYGKNKNNLRIIYGSFTSYNDAKEAINSLDEKLKMNKPYIMKMENFQHFYAKYYPNTFSKSIVKLQMKDNSSKELGVKPRLNDEIKILKQKEIVKQKIKKEEKPKKAKTKTIKTKVKKVLKKRVDLNAGKYLKSAGLEDVYYVESRGNFNILSEVFLKDNSSFYTIDLGELKLDKVSIKKFFKQNNLNDNTLAYKYGNNKEYARVIFGAYEDEQSAKEELSKIDLIERRELKVSNIKNHQKLYKTFHNNVMKKKPTIIYEDIIEESYVYKNIIDEEIVYTENEKNVNNLKEELFNKASKYYTITLITFDKKDIAIKNFFKAYGLDNDVLAYSLGARNNYYRVLYGLYETYSEALEAIENLDEELQRNKPYVSKIKTNQKKYESYKGKVLDNKNRLLKKIELQ